MSNVSRYFYLDINECFLDNACEPNAKCQNTIGSYNCLCEPGFRSDGKNCVGMLSYVVTLEVEEYVACFFNLCFR